MITGNKEVIGKRVWAYIPKQNGGLEFRQGSIEKFLTTSTDPMYMIKYDGIEIPHAASPSWLIFEPHE